MAEQSVVADQRGYSELRRPRELNPHGWARPSFDIGFITQVREAVRDPLFFLLHANVDRLWAKWQWFNARLDPSSKASYFFRSPASTLDAERIGHNAPDTM